MADNGPENDPVPSDNIEEDASKMDLSTLAYKVRNGELPVQDIDLMPHQIAHFRRITDEILPRSEGYLDGSPTGRGKTIVAAAVSVSYNIPIFVICPAGGVENVWRDAADAYGIETIDIVSYPRICGKFPRGYTKEEKEKIDKLEVILGHGYLKRINTPNKKQKVSFEPTEKLMEIINRPGGVLFIFDECHKLKDFSTGQFRACRTIAYSVANSGGKSRYALLSATPFDKMEFCISFYRILNIVSSAKLYTTRSDTGMVYLKGIQEVVDYANKYDRAEMSLIDRDFSNKLDYRNICDGHAREYIFTIFSRIIKNNIGSSLPDPRAFVKGGVDSDVETKTFDGYFVVPEEDRAAVRTNVAALAGAAQPIINGRSRAGDGALAGVTAALRALEISKVGLFARIARNKLMEKDTNRVVIGLHYTDSIGQLIERLRDYKPLVMTGKINKKRDQRREMVYKFQSPEEDHRLLICNVRVGGTGISLHDAYGDRATYSFLSPSYSAINTIQFDGRTKRTGLKSNAYTYLVYGVHKGCSETKIINALAKKGRNIKNVIPDADAKGATNNRGVRHKILLPGEYEVYREEDDEPQEPPPKPVSPPRVLPPAPRPGPVRLPGRIADDESDLEYSSSDDLPIDRDDILNSGIEREPAQRPLSPTSEYIQRLIREGAIPAN
jgi:hypothetical protein